MLKEDFKSEGSTAIDGLSWSISNAAQWIPTYAFRFYRHKDFPKCIAFISVLLDDDIIEHEYSIKEPIVTAGFLYFNQTDVSLTGNYWLAKYFGYMLNNRNIATDGTLFKSDCYSEGRINLNYAKVFAQPLTSIKNAIDVQDLIVTNLITVVKKEYEPDCKNP